MRRRRLIFGTLVTAALALAAILAIADVGRTPTGHPRGISEATAPAEPPPKPSSYAVGLDVMRLVEPGRTIQLPNGESEPRTLVTYVRYPALGSPTQTDVAGAQPARADGPFPLVIFGHGFEESPETYKLLLQAWARAGFVVVAPVFPLESAGAPGGPNEADLVNQPEDVRFLISRMLAEGGSQSGPLAGLIDPSQIAVTGQSDGGDTALDVGYDRLRKDPRVTAVIVLSGAQGPFSAIEFPAGGPPLLATQGTADPINKPAETEAFFEAASAPKYLLRLFGANHLPPYTYQQPQLETVERVTITFLEAYVEHRLPALERLRSVGNVPGVAELVADPMPGVG